VQALRRTGEVQGFRHRVEVAKVPQFHVRVCSDCYR
jgi:hypothetical protein